MVNLNFRGDIEKVYEMTTKEKFIFSLVVLSLFGLAFLFLLIS